MPDHAAPFLAFLTSLAVGLLIGLERERHAEARAGVRTFALIAMLGTLCAMLESGAGASWLVVGGLLATVGGIVAAYRNAGRGVPDAGATTFMAAALTYGLGVALWHGHREVVIAVAIVTTVLLHYKSQLEGFTARLNATDMGSLLQFAVLSLVILPVVPNRGYGPYGALNPYHLWLMVVLISAVSVAGYLAWRLLGGRAPALILGALGGLVSSTATTLVYARGAKGKAELTNTAATVILLANLVVLVRITVLTAVVAPSLIPRLAPVLAAGLVFALPVAWATWRRHAGEAGYASPELTNPTDLKVALGFAAAYAAILVAGAWLHEHAGEGGLYALAFASGLTDVDAISLSSMRLFLDDKIDAGLACGAIVTALCANIVVKASIAFAAGGALLGRRCLAGFLAMAFALVAGAFVVAGL
ncbi:MAG TPA: MgtC/SapB family protein [Usitatibacteraceae bacterium]|jgi:uncharacterized membrane protein (DUF4010 family)|nr:MgtC/SapB family protein [Usitatibacteraceae bacterium]